MNACLSTRSGSIISQSMHRPSPAIAGDGNPGDGFYPPSPASPLSRQPSMYSVPEELQKPPNGPAKTFGSMNMEEFMTNVWTTEGQAMAAAMSNTQILGSLSRHVSLQPQNNLSLLRTLSGKCVDELWRDIQPKVEANYREDYQQQQHPPPIREGTLGEMTLEDFLVRTGVVKDDVETDAKGEYSVYSIPSLHAQTITQPPGIQADWLNYAAPHQQQQHQTFFPPAEAMAKRGADLILTCNQDGFATTNSLALPPAISEYTMHSRKRGGDEIVVEKSLERRQRRMIKNRESAARSRARRQAYTMELEAEVTQLKEENARLKKIQILERRSDGSQSPPRRRSRSCDGKIEARVDMLLSKNTIL